MRADFEESDVLVFVGAFTVTSTSIGAHNFFAAGSGVERVFFPEKSNQVPDRAAVTLVVLPPDMSLQDEKGTTTFIESVTRESGSSSRTFKSALIFCVPESADALCDEARKVLAWEDIDDEADDLDGEILRDGANTAHALGRLLRGPLLRVGVDRSEQ